MKTGNFLVLLALLSVGGAASVRAEPVDDSRARMGVTEEQSASQKLIRDAAEAYRGVISDPEKQIPQSVLSKARCVAVVPGAVTAALVVGGTSGSGVASCRTPDNKWSPVSFIGISGGSLGAQIGGKSTDMVLFVMDPASQQTLEKGKFSLGADASVSAGTYGGTAEAPTTGIVAYQRSSGAFVGASLTGMSISEDKDKAQKTYGRSIDVASLLEGKETGISDEISRPLTSLLPQHA
jgi:lipid-binding SYLF domain-containing protein